MKSLEEILASGINLQEFENERQIAFNKNKKNLILAAIVGGAITILGVILLIYGFIGIMFILLGIITFLIWWGVVNHSLKKNLKQKIYSNLANKLDPNLQYVSDNKGFSEMFRKSGLIKGYTSVSADDGFKGTIEGVSFTIVEAKAEQKRDKSSVTVFRGPFYYLNTNQQFPYTTIIPDSLERGVLGKFGAVLQKADLSRLNQKNIRIEEDPQFEKFYAVWTKDEAFARKVLTPQLRVFLLTKNNTRFYLGFRENFIFMALDTMQDLFEIKLKESINQNIVRNFYNDFMTYYSILEQILPLLPLNAPIIQQQQQPPQPPKF